MKTIASILLLHTALFVVQAYAGDARTASTATKEAPFMNSLGMKFVPVEITGGPTNGKRVLFSIWETRVKDFGEYAKEGRFPIETLGVQEGPNHPVEGVAWVSAKAFCEWLTMTERVLMRIGASDMYRLPSDHEWSCAVGIGKLEKAEENSLSKSEKIEIYPWGKQWPPPKGACVYDPSLGTEQVQQTSEVGQFLANENGLYDLIDNVWEWCADDPFPDGPHDRGRYIFRVVRGSPCDTFGRTGFLSSKRGVIDLASQVVHAGFRCVLEVHSE